MICLNEIEASGFNSLSNKPQSRVLVSTFPSMGSDKRPNMKTRSVTVLLMVQMSQLTCCSMCRSDEHPVCSS